MLTRMWGRWITCTVWWKSSTDALENVSATSHKTKRHDRTTHQCIIGHLSQRNGNLCSHRNVYANAPGTFIHDGPKLDTKYPSTGEWLHKLVRSYTRILLLNNKELTAYKATWADVKGCIWSEKSIWEDYIRYDSIYFYSVKIFNM